MPRNRRTRREGGAGHFNMCAEIYSRLFFLGGFGQEFVSVSASVCDSRNWNSRTNSFVRAPSSGGSPNAPWPGSGTCGLSEKSEKCAIFGIWSVYARAIFGS